MAANRIDARRTAVVTAYTLIGMMLFTVSGPNLAARMLPAFSVVDRGTFAIDSLLTEQPTEDVSHAGGRTYSNKAPGLLIVSVPAYMAVGVLALDTGAAYNMATWITQVVGAVLPTAMFLLLLNVLLQRRYGLSSRSAAITTWAAAFGTLILPYTIAVFGHQTAGALIGIAVTATLLDHTEHGVVRGGTAFLSALLLGMAAATDYLAAIPAVMWTIWYLSSGGVQWRNLAGWALGATIPLLALGAYHWITMGAPWRFPYSTAALNPMFSEAVEWHWPDPGLLLELTFGPRRGLLFANPLLVAAVGGAIASFWPRGRAEHRIAAVTLGIFLVLLSSWNSWHGGDAVGPRYMVSAMPFAVLLLVPPVSRFPKATTALAMLSACGMILVSVVGPIVPLDRPDPFWHWAIPEFLSSGGTTDLPWGRSATTPATLLACAGLAFGALGIGLAPARSPDHHSAQSPQKSGGVA
jgi:hypothetical protein